MSATRPQPHPERPEPEPFFVLGPSRAGTTLLATLLDHHPRIAVYDETQYYPLFHDLAPLYGDLGQPQARRRLARDIREVIVTQGLMEDPGIDALLQCWTRPGFAGGLEAWIRLHARRTGKLRGGDKTPDHISYLTELRREFPASPLLFVVRDPRDVVLSMRRAFATDLESACRHWSEAVAAATAAGSAVRWISYERLVREPQATLTESCRHLEESFEPAMLRFFEETSRRRGVPAHHRRLQEAVDDSSVGRFRVLPRRDLARIEAACAADMERLGYALLLGPADPRPPAAPSRLRIFWQRLRYYGWNRRRWRWGRMRWKIWLRAHLEARSRRRGRRGRAGAGEAT